MRSSSNATARWPKIISALLALPLLAMVQPVMAAPLEAVMPGPTPLVLKDGRIAHVTVHTIPFNLKNEDLDGDTANRLKALLAPMATDCFLTAQAIGHVRPGDQADGDTLSAHRLARARADRVQQSLIGMGLPASSVASVWDWQFIVKEPRVTLWVFRLNEGEDCEGKPLSGAAVASDANGSGEVASVAKAPDSAPKPLVAAKAESPKPLTDADRTTAPEVKVTEIREPEAKKPTTPEPPKIAAVEQPKPVTLPADLVKPPAPSSIPEGAERIEPAPRSDNGGTALKEPDIAAEVANVLGDAATTTRDTAKATVGAVESGASAAGAAVAGAAATTATKVEEKTAPAAPIAAAAANPAVTAPSTASAAAQTAVTFAVNSSFFGGSGASELERMVNSLAPGGTYRIELLGAVGSDPVRGGDVEESRKYNRWMAERRVERVAEWLAGNSAGRNLQIDRLYRENDPSRTVNVTARPAS